MNVFGLVIRTILNFCFQSSIILAFKYATLAEMNQGVVTSLFSTYCVFTSLIFYFLFKEQLQRKFIIGIAFMLACVALVSCPPPSKNNNESSQGIDVLVPAKTDTNMIAAITFGLMAPLFISVFISVSRYWTLNYGYKSQDLTLDTFMLIGFLELGFFINYHNTTGYTSN